MEASEALERAKALKLDTEPTRRMLGSLGLVDALLDDTSTNPIHIDSQWQQPESDV